MWKIKHNVKFEGGDGLIYYPSSLALEPAHPNDRDSSYKLVNIFEIGGLWDQRSNANTFALFGIFLSDNGAGKNKAHAPWAWDDEDDGIQFQGIYCAWPNDCWYDWEYLISQVPNLVHQGAVNANIWQHEHPIPLLVSDCFLIITVLCAVDWPWFKIRWW